MFCRLKAVQRVASRYDKRADTFLSTIFIAAIVAWSIN
jgi:putative transposase